MTKPKIKMLFIFVLYGASLSAFKLINGNSLCYVSFALDPIITIVLESEAELGEKQINDILINAKDLPSLSFLVSYVGQDFSFQFNEIPKDATIKLPSLTHLKEEHKEDPTFFGQLGSYATTGIYYMGSLISAPLGALTAMGWGAQIGGPLALKYGPLLFYKNAPLLLAKVFSPLWPLWFNEIGATAGWILGGAVGAVGAPIIFILAFKGSEKLISYTYRAPQELSQDDSDIDDFVLLSND